MKNTGRTYGSLSGAANTNLPLVRLRELRDEIDAAVMLAEGWGDLGHGYHEQPNLAENDRVRLTISGAARAEVLRRFPKLNRQHYEEEQAAARPRAAKGRAKAVPASQGALALVDAPEAEPNTSKTKAAAPAKKATTRSTR